MKNLCDKRVELALKLEKYNKNFETNYLEIKKIWYKYFTISLKELGIKSQKSINILFWEWKMDNWKAMHKENSEYKEFSKKQMYNSFCNEAHYISDRISLDRIFRTHWLFREIFRDEISEEQYKI